MADQVVQAAPRAVPAGGRAGRAAGAMDVGFARAVVTTAVVGLAVRIGYAVQYRLGEPLRYDGPIYRNRAQFLLEGRAFLNPDEWFFHNRYSQGAIHPPGNSVFLALGNLLGFHSDDQLMVWSSLLGTATVVVVALLGRAVAGRRVGIVAGAIAALSPALWSNDTTLMAETPGQFFTALTLLLAFRLWQAPSPSRAGWLGAAAAGAALMRSEAALLLPLLVLPVCVFAPGVRRQKALRLGAAVLWSVVALAPWVGWNLVRFEHPVTLASGLDLSLAYAQCDATWYGRETGYFNTFCGEEIPDRPENLLADESELGQQYRTLAGDYVSSHKERLPAVLVARAGRTLGLYHPLEQTRLEANRENRDLGVLQGALWATVATAALSVVAFVRPPRPRRELLLLLTPLLAGTAGAVLTFGTSRYRSMGEIGLTVLAAVGVDAILRLVTAARAGPAGGPDASRPPS